MISILDDEATRFDVVKNDEDQFSIWPQSHTLPDGWTKVEMSGSKADCLEYIETHWTDMRPASLRAATDANQAAS